jgi:hypothetical protein
MSVLDRVREKFKTPTSGSSRGSKSPSAGSAGTSAGHIENRGVPSAGFAGSPYSQTYRAGADDIVPLSRTQERARRRVLAQLDSNPTLSHAFVNRFEAGVLILTLAVRGTGTCELHIAADRFASENLDSYSALLSCFDAIR